MSTENTSDSSTQPSTTEVNDNHEVKNILDTTEEPQQEKMEVTTEDTPVTTTEIKVTEENKDSAAGDNNADASQEIKEETKEETKVETSSPSHPSSDSTSTNEAEKAVDNDKEVKEEKEGNDKEENEEEGEGDGDKKETKKKGGKRKGKKGKRNSTPKKEGDNSNNTPNNRRRSSRNKNSNDVENSPAKKQKVEDDDDEEMEEDNKLYCICRKPYDGSFMVACDSCLEWYHPTCIGSTEEKLKKMKKYICDKCKPSSAPDHGSDMLRRRDDIEKKLVKLNQELDDVNRQINEEREKQKKQSPKKK